MTARAMSNQIAFRYRSIDSAAVSRERRVRYEPAAHHSL